MNELTVIPSGAGIVQHVQHHQQQASASALAIAARERATIEARYLMAYQNPRNLEQVRVDMLAACKRPMFCKLARYKVPSRGDGWTIRFVEQAIRMMRNIEPVSTVLHDDFERRIIRVSVTDLESNIPYSTDIVVEKFTERSKPEKEGDPPTRMNSKGMPVWSVPATEDDLTRKANSAISKALRNLGQRLIPFDILEECLEQYRDTQKKDITDDPERAKNGIIDAFATWGITPIDLEMYLGHPVARSVPAEIQDLREVYSSIKNGETNWSEVIAAKFPVKGDAQEKVAQIKIAELEAKVAMAATPNADGWPFNATNRFSEQKSRDFFAGLRERCDALGVDFDGIRMSHQGEEGADPRLSAAPARELYNALMAACAAKELA